MNAAVTSRLLGLGRRAGSVVVGTNGVRAALRRGELRLVILAGDRSLRTNDKVGRLARAKGVTMLEGPSAATLGESIGSTPVQVVGVKDAHLAAGLMARARVVAP